MNVTIDETPFMKALDACVLFAAFLFNALFLDAEWYQLAIAVGGSASGAVMLAYFRRDTRKSEQFFKVIASSIGGLVLGSVLQEYLHIELPAYRLGLFFVCSMLSLVVLRSLLNLTENNVSDILRQILQRIFNLRVETKQVKRQVRRNADEISELKSKIEGDSNGMDN